MYGLVGRTLRIIETDADVEEGAAWLAALDPRFAVALEQTGRLPLRRRENGFGALMNTVVGQQVSKASALAIWKRVKAVGLDIQANVVAASELDLQSAGLSQSKVRCSKALAGSLLNYSGLYHMTDDKRHQRVMQDCWDWDVDSRGLRSGVVRPAGCVSTRRLGAARSNKSSV